MGSFLGSKAMRVWRFSAAADQKFTVATEMAPAAVRNDFNA
jgi:hypothetical protein